MIKSVKFTTYSLMSIILAIMITVYLTIIIFKYPLVGMEVKSTDNRWIVERIVENGWASSQSIEEGDIVELVDGEKPERHTTVVKFSRVEMADSITIIDQDSKRNTYAVTYKDSNGQYLIYLFLPLVFSITTIILSVFLYRRKKYDKTAVILIYFLLTIGVSYLSAPVSAKGDIIGRMLNTITLPGSLLLFAHFLKSYFGQFNLVFIKSKSVKRLYIVYSVIVLVTTGSFVQYGINEYMLSIELLFFLSLLVYLLVHIMRFYFKYKNTEASNVLKILLPTLFSSLLPFAGLYAIPTLLFGKELVQAEMTAIFLLIIPIGLVYLQLAEKLFDIEFLLNRLRYYTFLSFPFTSVVVIVVCFLLKIDFLSKEMVMMFTLLLISTILFLYIKEYVDYYFKNHLFSQKGNYENSLYLFFQKAKHETKVSSLITSLQNEIKQVLKVKNVFYIERVKVGNGEKWTLTTNEKECPDALMERLEKTQWDHHRTGSLIEVVDGVGIIIGGDHDHLHIIFCGIKRSKANLNIQERIWLESLAYFSGILLENFQLIEGLFEKIESYKVETQITNTNYPYWLSRLLFSLSEKERANLSIDLHDSVLQEQLQLLRDVEKIKVDVEDPAIENELTKLIEKILDSIHLIRETCNELQPPFLSELGIVQSIQVLIDQTKLRCDFILKTELDPSIQQLDKEYELTLYRVIQELLNNASKHSLATEVEISLQKTKQLIILKYSDNGKGFDMAQLQDSFKTMGIFGMKERVKSINGTIDITSARGKGTQVFIEIKTGGTAND
ncbi:sensor histidine kinase [Sporosarcina sp. PTS2304]|uniref:sensor histidine kinase n=1 Tax=Sporosarcina sp. PTS2304 TaxID=2283194 RepID=UPI000E0E0508|nr:sensor histidine kinase [Sporosarcina sp. PTS2304]AXI01088.1 sensor histidine kinase [Sporosarcina sp. PTS2304]